MILSSEMANDNEFTYQDAKDLPERTGAGTNYKKELLNQNLDYCVFVRVSKLTNFFQNFKQLLEYFMLFTMRTQYSP